MTRMPRKTLARSLAAALALTFVAAACTPPPPCPNNGAACTQPRGPAQRVLPFAGVGSWVDVYDWAPSNGSAGVFDHTDIADLRANGVTTLYIQTSRPTRDEVIVRLEEFKRIVAEAHRHGMYVVSWYLPGHSDVEKDWVRLVAPVWFGADGIAYDIEDTSSMPDVATRNYNLSVTAVVMRAMYPDLAMAAITISPVALDILAPNRWPDFPWTQMKDAFDVWMPMLYWTYRGVGTEWRDVDHYVTTSIQRLRDHLGDPTVPVHPVGDPGLNETGLNQFGTMLQTTTAPDMAAYVAAAAAEGSIGVSLYDDTLTSDAEYTAMAPFGK
jgi:hypothetical protein